MTTLVSESSAVCSECSMRLESWAEFHPVEACRLHRSGMSAGFVRFSLRSEQTLARKGK